MNNELLSYINNKEAEESVLATLIIHPHLIDELFIKPEFMSSEVNKATMKAIIELHAEGYKIDIVTIMNYVSESKNFDTGEIFERLKQLSQSEFESTNIVYHQNKVIDAYRKREQAKALTQAMNSLMDSKSGEIYKKLIDTFERLEAVTNQNEDDGHISKVMQRIYETMVSPEDNIYSQTHFRDLDALFKFKRQDLIVLGARPSMGKTAFAMGLGVNHAFKSDKPVIIFSKEMPNESVGSRMLSSETNVNMERMKEPDKRMTKQDWERVVFGVGEFSNKKMHMFDDTKMTTQYIRKKCRQIQKLYPGEHMLIIIDYLQLLDSDNPRQSRNDQVGDISRDLKRIARETDSTLIALSQLSREVEKRNDKRPMNSDLRDSGGVEQDADVIVMLYRDDYYDRNSDQKDLIEAIVTKNRNGAIGTATLGFRKELSKFINIG